MTDRATYQWVVALTDEALHLLQNALTASTLTAKHTYRWAVAITARVNALTAPDYRILCVETKAACAM